MALDGLSDSELDLVLGAVSRLTNPYLAEAIGRDELQVQLRALRREAMTEKSSRPMPERTPGTGPQICTQRQRAPRESSISGC
jgi:hypothetical protein